MVKDSSRIFRSRLTSPIGGIHRQRVATLRGSGQSLSSCTMRKIAKSRSSSGKTVVWNAELQIGATLWWTHPLRMTLTGTYHSWIILAPINCTSSRQPLKSCRMTFDHNQLHSTGQLRLVVEPSRQNHAFTNSHSMHLDGRRTAFECWVRMR